VWPEVLEAFDSALAAVTTNAANFHQNFLVAKEFIKELGGHEYQALSQLSLKFKT
jgi:hypothetical protein